MVKHSPDVEDNAMLSMVEAARALGVSYPTIVKYEKMEIIKPHFRLLNGRKFIYGKELKKLWAGELTKNITRSFSEK
jgi:hypothetical protein